MRRGIVIDKTGNRIGTVKQTEEGYLLVRLADPTRRRPSEVRIVWLDLEPDLANYPCVVIA
jgi:hypothetical protein